MAIIIIKNSQTEGNIPSDLVVGELALNTADGILYCLGGDSGGATWGPHILAEFNHVTSVNGATGAVTLTDLVGVETFNGLSGAVDVSATQTIIGGVTLGTSGALIAAALNVNNNYNFPTGAGSTGDVLMIADDGDLEFESFRTSTTFVVDSDIPLATGVRYKGLYEVPFPKMAVTNIELRSDDVSPVGVGNSLSVALKTIQRNSSLEAASPLIQGTVETVSIPLGGQYHDGVTELNIGSPDVGSGNSATYLVVDVTANSGNHTNFTMMVRLEART